MLGSRSIVLVGGFRKCGTTSIYDLLAELDGFNPCSIKEPQIIESGNLIDDELFNEYISLFGSGEGTYLDGSTFLTTCPEVVLDLKKYFPDIKIVIFIRDPVKRFFSAAMHSYGKITPEDNEPLDNIIHRIDSYEAGSRFDLELKYVRDVFSNTNSYSVDYLKDIGSSKVLGFNPKFRYLAFQYYGEGCYSYWLNRWEELGVDYHLVCLEELINNKEKVLESLEQYLGLASGYLSAQSIASSNAGYIRRGFISKLERFSILKSILPFSVKNKVKDFFYQKASEIQYTEEQQAVVASWYAAEYEYWLEKYPAWGEYWNGFGRK